MKYWPKMLALADKYAPIPAVRERRDALIDARNAITQQKLPQRQLPKLELPLAAYALAADVPGGQLAELMTLNHMFGNFRWYIAYHYGVWAYITEELIATWLREFPNRRYLELAAGNGVLSAGLRAAGAQVISTDAFSWVAENGTGKLPWTAVERASATRALWEYGDQVDAVILAWSPDKDVNDVHVLHTIREHFPNLEFFVIGDRFGITNSQTFWREAHIAANRQLLRLNQAFRAFDAVGDKIYLVK